MVTSNARLLIEQFDDQARKQYLLNGVQANPFDDDNMTAILFNDMDLFTKVSLLCPLLTVLFRDTG